MPRKFQILLSFGESYSSQDLPLSETEITRIFSETVAILGSDAKFKVANKKLGAAVRRLGIFVCGDQEMRGFQKSYRKLDRSTDVLSFPTLELPDADLKRVPRSELTLGDLVISLPAVARGAKRGKRSVRLELIEVLIHGVLHLVGFDHVTTNRGVTKAGAQKMRKIQKVLFLKLRAPIKS